jgi:uncharacterized phage protein (TIGR01671 family)|nr:MAG TPA: YopX protein [Caudoviricetes sp.]
MTLKFRAWDKETKTMNGMAEIYRNRNQEIELHPRDENIILMQSTGLKDKNGKEIFEGDILKFNDEWPDYCYEGYVDGSIEGVNYVEIKREKTCFTFGKTKIPESSLIDLTENEHYPFEELLTEASYEFEIIGNIYENPEISKEV